MRIAADTNVLVRVFVADDERQAECATEALAAADLVAVSLQSLCEFCWVLARGYGVARSDIAAAIRKLLDTENVAVDRSAVEAGLAILEGGGDFADGIVAHEGRRLGGAVFVSFDRKAVALVAAQGQAAELLS
ncbi:type II toxin-antitoxin system VapC family toxin [Enterovirga sp.]|uniref:type II toxin-antitoxin system VapC family toxin n=1 Tax=Enterovirga sp. TaxID=2026350 RepID=UPI002C5E8940|nr:type II toxin-antitoxin system VapC family toxin [Enterovirga sp.]HMO30488.1 type II toxin-antitoxin system VapC family toxin [Enterovirga sp.]